MEPVTKQVKRRSLWLQVGVVALLIVVAAPLIFTLLQATVALVVSGLLITSAIAFGPLWGAKLANWTLRGAIAEATRNPIETLWNDFATRQHKLEAFVGEVQKFKGKILSTRDQFATFARAYPDEAPKFSIMLDNMENLYNSRKMQLVRAQEALKTQRHEIEKAEAMYAMAQSAASLQAASGMKTDVMKDVMAKTALSAVSDQVNSAFAQLDTLMLARVDTNFIEGRVLAREVTPA